MIITHACVLNFNPRPPAEGDAPIFRIPISTNPISIHALPRRATTGCNVSERSSIGISIHALPRRATDEFYKYFFDEKFQSTPSRGGRRCRDISMSVLQVISIHVLPRRATLPVKWCSIRLQISIHALPRRATVPSSQFIFYIVISIHALPRRATCCG